MSTSTGLVIESVLDKKIASMDFNDWRLTFNYEGETGKPVSQVTVNGIKGNNAGNLSYYYNKNSKQVNISFNGVDAIDQDVLQSMYETIVEITKSPT